METKPFDFHIAEKKSLDEWAVTVLMPVLEAILTITGELEKQLQELE